MRLSVTTSTDSDLDDLADVAARTFGLACPPTSTPHDVASFITATLSRERFAGYLADPDRVVLSMRDDGRMIGYAMLIRGVGDDPDVARAIPLRPAVELSKCYVLADAHGMGGSAALMAAVIARAADLAAACVWLGVNQQNQRAQRFYTKHGFTVTGTKTFQLGTSVEHDYVMTLPLPSRRA